MKDWKLNCEFDLVVVPNDKCQSMGIFQWKNKILGVLGEVSPLTGDKKPEMA